MCSTISLEEACIVKKQVPGEVLNSLLWGNWAVDAHLAVPRKRVRLKEEPWKVIRHNRLTLKSAAASKPIHSLTKSTLAACRETEEFSDPDLEMELRGEADICVCRADKNSMNWEIVWSKEASFPWSDTPIYVESTIQGDRRCSPHSFGNISYLRVKNGNMKELRPSDENKQPTYLIITR